MKNNEEEIPEMLQKDNQDSQDLDIIAEAIMDVFQSCSQEEEQDPFDLYSKKIRTRFYEDKESFKKKFEDGYHVLIEELSQTNK